MDGRTIIRIRTELNGKTVLDRMAKQGVSVDRICAIAEDEVLSGYADYAVVTINGKIYMELEA